MRRTTEVNTKTHSSPYRIKINEKSPFLLSDQILVVRENGDCHWDGTSTGTLFLLFESFLRSRVRVRTLPTGVVKGWGIGIPSCIFRCLFTPVTPVTPHYPILPYSVLRTLSLPNPLPTQFRRWIRKSSFRRDRTVFKINSKNHEFTWSKYFITL